MATIRHGQPQHDTDVGPDKSGEGRGLNWECPENRHSVHMQTGHLNRCRNSVTGLEQGDPYVEREYGGEPGNAHHDGLA